MVQGVTVVHGDRGLAVDGIRDHGGRLVTELARRRLSARELRLPVCRRRGGSRQMWRALRRSRPGTAIVVQYSPFCYGRWGFAPWLPAMLIATRSRRRSRRPLLAVMIHEPYVPMSGWRWALMGSWQRLQLGAVRLGADAVFTSIEPWVNELAGQPPRGPVVHLPVGSNFPDGRAQREQQRRRLGIEPNAIVLSCLGTDHPGWLPDYVAAAADAVAAAGSAPPVLLNLGAQAPALGGLDPRVEVRRPGYLTAPELAASLAASDLFLLPLVDGVSTRRGALMAALQHGLPVVGTAGPLTDSILRRAAPALRLTTVGDRGAFAAAAAALAHDPAARAEAGAAARALYESEFDWPVIADRLLAELAA
jgi:glycosyltransferase involved in cell wall biosynthesis